MGELFSVIFTHLPFFWEKRKTRFGLFTLFVILFFIFFILIISFLDKIIGIDVYWYFVIPIIYFIAFIWWLISSGRLVLQNKKFTIVLALKSQNIGGVKYVNDSIAKLKNEIRKISLKRKIKIIVAGDDIINDKDGAHFYRERFDIDLVIWGTVFSGKIEEKEVFDFKDLYFTYKVPPPIIQNNLRKIFEVDIKLSLINRDWNLYEINSLPGIEKIGSHLSEIIRFIIGIIYSFSNEHAIDSICLLENLFNEIENRTKDEKITQSEDKKTITMSQSMFWKGRLQTILIDVYKNMGLHFISIEEYQKGKFFLEKFFAYNQSDRDVLTGLCLSAFKINGIEKAEEYNDVLRKNNKYDPIFLVNKAFFEITKGNYTEALNMYKKLFSQKSKVELSTITQVISFLDNRKIDNPDELAYEFAIGLLNYNHCQRDVGEKELKNFIDRAENDDKYDVLVRHLENVIFRKKGKRNID